MINLSYQLGEFAPKLNVLEISGRHRRRLAWLAVGVCVVLVSLFANG